jgi:hypothetical protein
MKQNTKSNCKTYEHKMMKLKKKTITLCKPTMQLSEGLHGNTYILYSFIAKYFS